MKLVDQWDDLTVPGDLVYFSYRDRRLIMNPGLASWCVLSDDEARVLPDPPIRGLLAPAGPGPAARHGRGRTRQARAELDRLPAGREPQVRAEEPPLKLV